MPETPKSSSVVGLHLRVAYGLLLGAMVAHFYFVTVGWNWGFMIGHEFRQTQTALITYYIDLQNNFSIDYETPIFGPPWQMPLELPVYQWVVVLVKRAFDLADFQAARTVSLASFYLALPGVWLLLKRCRLSAREISVVIALVALCPVYIFYSRAFLIDPMAFMFSVWFLALFVEMMRSRRIWLILGCTVCGTLAVLIKSLVFMVWLFPAALYGAYCLLTAWKAGGLKSSGRTVLWGVGSVVLPFLALVWWVDRTDSIKALSPVTAVFTSEGLSTGNFGMFSLEARFSWHTWHHMFLRWGEALTFPWVIGGFISAAVIFCPQRRRQIAGAFALFMFGQLMIPYAYTGQDYYFYTCAVLGVVALGFSVLGFAEKSNWPAIVRVVLFAVPFLSLAASYLRGYYPMQQYDTHGGSGLMSALAEIVPTDGVIVVQGDDWSAIRPYYTKRRSFMIRNGMERNDEYMEFGLSNLKTERVDALMVSRDLPSREEWTDEVCAKLGLNPWPTIGNERFLVFFHPLTESAARSLLSQRLFDATETYPPSAESNDSWTIERELLPGYAAAVFPVSGGVVSRYLIGFGYGLFELEGREVQNFHANSYFKVSTEIRSGQVRWSYGLSPDSYEREGDKTNGVSFMVYVENPEGARREIFRRDLNPTMNPTDRGFQLSNFEFSLVDSEQLVFASDAMGSEAFDWSYLEYIEIGSRGDLSE